MKKKTLSISTTMNMQYQKNSSSLYYLLANEADQEKNKKNPQRHRALNKMMLHELPNFILLKTFK